MTELDREDLAPIVELQAVELKRLLRENERLSRRVDALISELGQLRELQKRELGLRQGQQDLLLQMQEGTNRLLRLLETTRSESAPPPDLGPVDGGVTERPDGNGAEPPRTEADDGVAEEVAAGGADVSSSAGEVEREPCNGEAPGGDRDEREANGNARLHTPIPEFLRTPVDGGKAPRRKRRRGERTPQFAVDLKRFVLPTRIGSLS
ncbi:MAG: hypothetical protein ACE5Q3_12515 [Alphaproteobacteria bacterium]